MALWCIFAIILSLICSNLGANDGIDDFIRWSERNLPGNLGREELERYYLVWKENSRYVEEHNSKDSTFKLEMNKFAHLAPNELRKLSFHSIPSKTQTQGDVFLTDIPAEVDWRDKGDVTSVHNQGQSDCAFEIVFTDVVSSFYAIQTGKLVQFSPQQLIDCCSENCSCNRLLEPGQLAYCIKKHGGLCSDYPNRTGECECLKCNGIKFMIRGMREVHSGNETALQYAVAMEPVMVGVDAGQRSFQLYKEGIYSDPECSSVKLDHLLLLVGYGSEDGRDYWLLKNSWGVEWGMSGYIKIARNDHNMCGIATAAYYPY